MLCFPGFANVYFSFMDFGPPPHPGLNSLEVQDSRRTEFPRDFGPGGTEFPRELDPPDPKIGGGGGSEFPVTPA